MTRRPIIILALTGAVLAAAVMAVAGGGADERASTAKPRIFGGAPVAQPTATPRPTTDADAERLAEQWTRAWDRVTVCPNSAKELRTVIALSAGVLAEQLEQQPPRPGADPACKPKQFVAARTIASEEQRRTVIVERKGESGGPLTLTIQSTSRGLRVVGLDY